MTNEAVTKYLETKNVAENAINIHFKTRSTITGLFVKGNDFEELRSKNFWRIVTQANLTQWEKTKDISLAKIFNGMEFTRFSEQ